MKSKLIVKRKFRIHFSYLLSFLLHLILFYNLQKSHAVFERLQPNTHQHKKDRQTILEEVFEQIAVEQTKACYTPEEEPIDPPAKIPNIGVPEIDDPIETEESMISSFSSNKYKDLKAAIPLYEPSKTFFSPESLFPPIDLSSFLSEEPVKKELSLSPEKIEKTSSNAQSKEKPTIQYKETKTSLPISQAKRFLHKDSVFSLENRKDNSKELPSSLPSKEDLNTLSWSESFDLEVEILEQKDQEILFAVTLFPKRNVAFKNIPQNIHFLIDTANGIQAARLKSTKYAVQRAISYLEKEDAFSIIGFDGKMVRMSPECIYPNTKGKNLAKSFLQSLQLGNIFSFSDPYKPLYRLLHEETDPNVLSNIILITNGDGLFTKEKSQKFIKEFTQTNRKKFSLFCLAIDQDAKIPLMNALAEFNQGVLYTSPTKGGLKRRLCKLVKSIQSPIAKNIHATAISRGKNQSIELLPSNNRIKNLYANGPLVLVGKTDRKKPFTLVIQGKALDGWIQIQKEVNLAKAGSASSYLKEEWTVQNALKEYERYFETGSKSHIQNGNKLLVSNELEPLFP